jgi:hypothetical protein
LPASFSICFLNSVSKICPWINSQSWRTSSWRTLYCSNPSLLHGFLLLPGSVYLVWTPQFLN